MDKGEKSQEDLKGLFSQYCALVRDCREIPACVMRPIFQVAASEGMTFGLELSVQGQDKDGQENFPYVGFAAYKTLVDALLIANSQSVLLKARFPNARVSTLVQPIGFFIK
ncbi:MAG TPA: hypothetical protein PLK94_06035 [Alphaproteobacteria bacterium]|nr:hypothetical protein [Alphaproteobacteria bacterium]HOO50832.1 hypothetical protein [Alphaproteobacteria bacterium]